MARSKKMKPKIIFIGTPEFGAIILEKLIGGGYAPSLVITETDKPAGRKKVITPPPVKIAAQKFGISIAQPDRIKNYKSEIENLKPDLMVVAAYGQIIPKEILEIPQYGCLNVHPSLLPKYRGPAPVQSALLSGDSETGVSIMLLDEKMDHGPIIKISNFKIQNPKVSYRELHNQLAILGAKSLIEIIPQWLNKKIKPMPQDDSKATYSRILKREDGKINWTKSAQEIERQIRAFDPWPGSFAECGENKFKIKMIKIWRASIQEQTGVGPFGEPGKTYMATNEKIAVQTGKDFLIIEELQPESGKKMLAKDFLAGRSDFIGTMLK
jgi:methionyl-tRNA formyltransferase